MRPEQRLSAFVAGLRWGDVPPPVARKVVDHALDAVGVMCAGRSAPSSIPVRTLFTEAGGVAEASVIGGATALPAPAAAFVNAFHGRVHTFDDTYDAGPIHPGSVVLAAALAAAANDGAHRVPISWPRYSPAARSRYGYRALSDPTTTPPGSTEPEPATPSAPPPRPHGRWDWMRTQSPEPWGMPALLPQVSASTRSADRCPIPP